MTGLTGLTVAAARDGLRQKKFSAGELTEAHIAAVAAARPLNAYLVETPERARAMAAESDRRLARGEAARSKACRSRSRTCSAPRTWRPPPARASSKDFRPPYELTVTANLWRAGAAMLGKLNMDEFAMGSANVTSAYGNVENPWRLAARQPAARAGRIVGRLGRGGGGARGPCRHRHRYRRLDPPARELLRHRRIEADLRTLLTLGHRRVRVLARPGRADDAHGGGRRHHAGAHGRATIRRISTSAPLPVPDFEAAVGKSVRGLRIGIPREYRLDGMPAAIDALWQAGPALARSGRRQRRRDRPAAHEIRAAGLLHYRAGRGVVEPRAL